MDNAWIVPLKKYLYSMGYFVGNEIVRMRMNIIGVYYTLNYTKTVFEDGIAIKVCLFCLVVLVYGLVWE